MIKFQSFQSHRICTASLAISLSLNPVIIYWYILYVLSIFREYQSQNANQAAQDHASTGKVSLPLLQRFSLRIVFITDNPF